MQISIYHMAGGNPREMRADANLTASGPFDSPDMIMGKLISLPTTEELREIEADEVLSEGEVFRFRVLRPDGSFELKKICEL